MTTPADFTTRTRTQMFNVYEAYLSIKSRVTDMNDEVTALGGQGGGSSGTPAV